MEPTYDEAQFSEKPPPAPGPAPTRPQYPQNPSQSSLRDRHRENPTPPPISRLASSSSQHQRQGSRNISGGSSIVEQPQHRSRPSRDRDMYSEKPNGYGDRQQPNLTAATSEVVVPNKSRLREEEIEVPYARDSQLMETLSPAATDDREYYDRMSFSSNLTNKSKQAGLVTGWDEDREQKIRAEYEFRIAGLERRTAMAEAEREEARRSEVGERDRRKEWEEEVRGLKEVRELASDI